MKIFITVIIVQLNNKNSNSKFKPIQFNSIQIMLPIQKISNDIGFFKLTDLTECSNLQMEFNNMNTQNILLLDCSGSINSCLQIIIEYWNNNFNKLNGDINVILFAKYSIILNHSLI